MSYGKPLGLNKGVYFRNKHKAAFTCLLEDFHKYNRIKSDYANLSLNGKPGMLEDEFANVETFEFSMRIKGTDISMKRKIFIMDDLTNEKLLLLNFSRFEDIVDNNGFDDETAGLVFSNLVRDRNYEDTLTKEGYKALKYQILEIIYTPSMKREVLNQMNNIKQIDYTSIKGYIAQINETIERYSRIEKLSKNEKKRKLEELFYRGLGPYTTVYVGDFFTKDTALKEVTEHLTSKEENLINAAAKTPESLAKDKDFKNSGSSDSKYNNSKWCSIHKKGNHTSEQCFSLKNKDLKKNDNNTSKNDTKSFIIKENINKSMKDVLINVSIEDNGYRAVIDIGSRNSFMSLKLQRELDLEPIEAAPINAVYGNGTTEIINKMVEVRLKLQEGLTRVENFYVSDTLPVDLIIGFGFLLNNGAIVDFQKGTIRIDGKDITINNSSKNLDIDLDERLVASPTLYEGGESAEENDSIKFIEKYTKDNILFKYMIAPEAKLDIDQKLPIIQAKPYSIPYKYLMKGREEINRLLKENIIEYSTSRFSSPGFFVVKKNGDLRLVVAYNQVNQHIIDDAFPIPNLEDSIYRLQGSKVFSSIDLKNGFNQIRLDKESRKLSAFTILGQHYQYKRVPFGLKSGPKLFQRRISTLLKDIDNCFVYIDDIVIFDKDEKDHQKSILKVLKILHEHQVKINFEKSEFFKEDINILGFNVNGDNITINTKFAESKIFQKEIKSKKDVQKLMGTINWYRKYIPHLSTRLETITNLLKKGIANFKLNNNERAEIQKICNELEDKNTLSFPDYSKKFSLYTDASNVGCGAALLQEDRIIGYFSRKFKKSELNYSIVEKEFLSIVLSLIHFEKIIQGCFVEVYTDSRNCTFPPQGGNSRIARWSFILNQFDYVLKSIKGTENVVADNISRNFLIGVDEFKEKYQDILNTYGVKVNGTLSAVQGKIRVKKGNEIEFLSEIHKLSGHIGISKMYYAIKNYMVVKNLFKNIKEVTKECKLCRRYKIAYNKHENVPFQVERPWEVICSDVFGPFNISEFVHDLEGEVGYILTITDVYSRYSRFYLHEKITSKEIIKALNDFIKIKAVLEKFVSDNGKPYASKELKNHLKRKNIMQTFIPAYTPSSNGISESLNKDIAFLLSLYRKSLRIEEITKLLNVVYNIGYKRTIKATPFEIIYGYNFYDIFETQRNILPHRNAPIAETYTRWQVDDIVAVRDRRAGKLDQKYSEERNIVEVGKRGAWVKLSGNSGWTHVKDLKLVRRG